MNDVSGATTKITPDCLEVRDGAGNMLQISSEAYAAIVGRVNSGELDLAAEPPSPVDTGISERSDFTDMPASLIRNRTNPSPAAMEISPTPLIPAPLQSPGEGLAGRTEPTSTLTEQGSTPEQRRPPAAGGQKKKKPWLWIFVVGALGLLLATGASVALYKPSLYSRAFKKLERWGNPTATSTATTGASTESVPAKLDVGGVANLQHRVREAVDETLGHINQSLADIQRFIQADRDGLVRTNKRVDGVEAKLSGLVALEVSLSSLRRDLTAVQNFEKVWTRNRDELRDQIQALQAQVAVLSKAPAVAAVPVMVEPQTLSRARELAAAFAKMRPVEETASSPAE